jgi:invasion protein IalB
MYNNFFPRRVPLKFLSSVSSRFCALLIAGGIVITTASITSTRSALAQDAPAPSNATSSISGNWQVSWTAEQGGQRQATMQLTQDGKKVSGSFKGERGSASLKGSSDGNHVSFTVKLPRRQVAFSGTVNGDKMSGTTQQGASWTATRQQ